MEYRTLELIIISANDLKYVNHFRKMDVYVVVSIVDTAINLKSIVAKQKTPVHKKGDKNPTWNHPVSFTLSDVALQQNRLTVVFQVYSKRFYFPVDKRIGEVNVPVSELLSCEGGGKEATRLSYQVRKLGKPQGVVNMTCKFGEKFARMGSTRFDMGPTTAYPYQPPLMQQQQQQQPSPMWRQPVSGYPPPPMQVGYGGSGYSAQRMGLGGGRSNLGMGLGAGLLGGALGGMLIGDTMSDSCYDDGFDGGFDGGGFDF